MNKGFPSTGEPSALQVHMSCKMCAFVGQNLVQHYVEVHPGAEIPVCLVPNELNTLISNAEGPVQQPVDSDVLQDDRIEIVVNFLKDLGKLSTFEIPVMCPLCSYSSVLRSEIISHLLIHETSNLVCYFCMSTEANLNDLRDHVSAHTGEYAYQCIHCKFCGVSSNDVAQHISYNHPGKEAKTIFENVFNPHGGCLKGYVCSTCGFIQMSKSSVEKHVSSVDLFCRGSYVIELDLSKGRKGASSATVVKGNYIPSAAESTEYIVPNSEPQAAVRNVSNLDSTVHGKNIVQKRIYIQDEIEIAPSDSHVDSILPFNDDSVETPVLMIKTEKVDGCKQLNMQSQNISTGSSISNLHSITSNTLSNSQVIGQIGKPQNERLVSKIITARVVEAEKATVSTPKKTINFTCASCQFNTLDEAQFVKHARTDHRSDLSLWCKNCGKCFSNAGVLVSHIKDDSCVKENMIYRCGVKECTFETPSGQTFVHHLRHCHKGSPFIFCVHCQKIFTLPHCLILHMQNDCPYKERNRLAPGQARYIPPSVPTPAEAIAALRPISTPPLVNSSIVNSRVKAKSVESSGRGRRKGRGRGKVITDSSESDPDDPSWVPSDAPRRGSRRSSRLMRSEASDSDNNSIKEPPGAFACACCDFSGNSNALLEDHYLNSHKKPGKIGCSICNLKFESTQNFLDHFVLHQKESLAGSETNKVGGITQTGDQSTEIKSEPNNKSPPLSSVVQVPYQAAIHEKNQRDSKLKSFEELKSKEVVTKMKKPVKLKHFFKCMLYKCTFTTDNNSYFISHLNENHYKKQLNCSFCFEEYTNGTSLTNHMIQAHGKRCYQCSACFYRAFSRSHVQIHVKNFHSEGKKTDIFICTAHLSQLSANQTLSTNKSDIATEKTIWPFLCALDGCKFETFEPDEFKKHNEISHRTVSVFICAYCKAEFISFKRLTNHYRLHGINNFQCTYCLHGCDTKEEILAHLSQNHADKRIKIHARSYQDSLYIRDEGKKQSKEQTAIGVSDHVTKPEDQRFQKKYGKIAKISELQIDDKIPSLIPKLSIHKIQKNPAVLEKIYPKHIAKFEDKFTCGIPNCSKQFEKMNFYLKHLRVNHSALNIICPYCYYAPEEESNFKDHLLFHGPNLYACDSDMCCYNHWNKNEVIKHIQSHSEQNVEIISVREQITSVPSMDLPDVDSAVLNPNADDCSKCNLSCPFCNYKTYDRVMMKKHIYTELEYARFQCFFCKERYTTRTELLSHNLCDHPDESILASMDINAEIEYLVKTYMFCLQTMSSGESKVEKSHPSFQVLTILNCESKPCLSCSDCQKVFTKARDWHNHVSQCLAQHFSTNVLKYIGCHYCNHICASESSLKLHSSLSHPEKQPSHSENPNKLEWMKENLITVRLKFLSFVISLLIKNCSGLVLSDLEVWQKNYKLESKLYRCSYCSFKDNFRFNIEKHIIFSHNDKPVKIEQLTKSFFTASPPMNVCFDNDVSVLDDSMILPVNRKDVPKQTKPFVCGICPHEFPCVENLKQHAVLDHAFQTNEVFPYFFCSESDNFLSEQNTFQCNYCKSGAMILPELISHHEHLHMRLPFKAQGSLIIETNASLTVKCGHCSETFLTRAAFYGHCNNVHPLFAVKEFSEVASGSRKRKFDSLENDTAAVVSANTSDGTECSTKNTDSDLYICYYCHHAFPSVEKIKAHFFVLHPRLPLKYESLPVPLKDDISISFGVTDFLDNVTSKESAIPAQNKKHKNFEQILHADSSNLSENANLNKITLHLAVKSRERSLKFPVTHLSQVFPLFPDVVLFDEMKCNSFSTMEK